MSDTSTFVTTALLEEKALSAEGAAKARAIAAERGVQLDEALVGIEGITAEKIAITRATIAEVPFVRLSDYTIDVANARFLPRSLAERHRVFPLFVIGQVATLAMVDPLDLLLLDRVRQSLQCELEPVACDPAALGDLIGRAYSMALEEGLGEAGAEASVESLLSGEEPIVAAVNQILAQAVAENASDVHISPDEHELQLRFRIDGDLHRRPGPPKSSHAGLVQRIKVMARMDLTQTRLPQDGKFRFTSRQRAVDVRASVLPTIHGENVVLRILATGAAIKGFAELGLSPDAAERIERVISHPHGMLLVTGPTGSGKTTTLYTALKRLNTPDANVMTIEDPVEIRLPMVRHVQVHAEAGMTFAGTLRAVLRQDPDVVLVGEIRDEETARTALQAALTGHLVLSTLHTNDASGAIPRLRDLGCAAFAVNAGLLGVLAQRLVARACQACALPCTPPHQTLAKFGLEPGESGFVQGAGCAMCGGQGSKGRLAVLELLEVTREVRALIDQGAGSDRLRAAAIRAGMRPMWLDGLDKALRGLVTLDDLAKAVVATPEDLSDSDPAGNSRRVA
ncbi:MAG: type II/IV secretion system protein [Phycisphaerales bacterium]|nr:type II/IV secretion system protein [Phycisphaerales bacterium]